MGCEFVKDSVHLIKALWALSTISPNDIIDDLGHYFDQGDARKLLALIIKLNREKKRLKLTRSWRDIVRELQGIETTSEDIAKIEQKVLTRLEASVHLRESLLDKSKDVVAGQLVTDLIECTADCYGVEDNPYVKLFATALPILVDLLG